MLAETTTAGDERAADSDDDEPPQLSEYALAALQEFYTEQEERERQFQAGVVEGDGGGVAIDEDWVGV